MRFVAVLTALLLAGCGSGSSGTQTPSQAPSPPSGKIVATRSGAASVAATVNGGAQSVAITFTAEDANTVDQLAIIQGLSSLPSGWQGPGSFTCNAVDTGSGCVLGLTYAPSAADSGVLELTYWHRDAGVEGTEKISIPYEATANNNAAATALPSGQIVAVVGEFAQAVSVTVTSDDGNPISNVSLVTALSSLPAGWSSSLTSFACTQASTGNGCQLPLSFAPTSPGSGTLQLAFDYRDNAGTAKSTTINLAYAANAHNSVIATASPSGPISAIVGAKQAVGVTFTTNDGRPASQVAVTTDLSALPAGWNSADDDFRCTSVATGNGCQLLLEFEPSAGGVGTLSLQYSYVDNANRVDSGTLMLNYAGTTQNSVVPSVSPAGQIATVVGGTQRVTVSFNTDDANSATQFAIVDDLSALPAGWSATTSTLSCPTISTLNACQLSLDYAPVAIGSGTLSLGFSYRNNSGVVQAGTVNIPYVATSNNNAVATLSPSGPAHAVVGNSLPATVTFTADDGHALSNLQITTNLASLPGQWSSGASSFACASVTSGTGCQLSLTYSPTFESSGTLTLNFNYVNHAGVSRTGSVLIPYASFGPMLYVPQTTADIKRCRINGASYDNCAISRAGPSSATHGMVFLGNRVYIAQRDADQLQLCNVEANGTFTGCVATATGLDSPWSLATLGGRIYVMTDHSPAKLYSCTPDADGLLTTADCAVKSDLSVAGYNIEAHLGYIFLMDLNGVQRCSLFGTGAVSVCINAGEVGRVSSLAFGNGKVFLNMIATNVFRVCDVNATTALFSGCTDFDWTIPNLLEATFHAGVLYVASRDGADVHIYYCPVDSNNEPTLGCPMNSSFSFQDPGQLRIR